MPEGYVRDISPLVNITPVRPHPEFIRQEGRRRGGTGKRGHPGKNDGDEDKHKAQSTLSEDRVTLHSERDASAPGTDPPKDKKAQTATSETTIPRHIDVRI
ncbi:MAG: hypothetical protein GXO58_10450 [Thermodesulfobacteria bacterium]|nr:hypothetical protein [Thermodesulfobacteriota bacterium]